MTIALTPDIEDALAEQARRQGTTPEQFVLNTLREKLAPVMLDTPRDEWEALLLSVGSPAGVSLSDEATSRDSLYD